MYLNQKQQDTVTKEFEIPFGGKHKTLNKFRYLQACMCEQISYVHWIEDIMRC